MQTDRVPLQMQPSIKTEWPSNMDTPKLVKVVIGRWGPTSLASSIKAMKFCSSNSMSFEILSRATPSRISSVLRRPAPMAANQQHSRTYRGSPAYPKQNNRNSDSPSFIHSILAHKNHYQLNHKNSVKNKKIKTMDRSTLINKFN